MEARIVVYVLGHVSAGVEKCRRVLEEERCVGDDVLVVGVVKLDLVSSQLFIHPGETVIGAVREVHRI